MTPEQKKWIKGVQRALNKPGGEGLGFFTIGDPNISIYDLAKQTKINEQLDKAFHTPDFCTAVDNADAHLGEIKFPSHVHSTAG